MAKKAPRKLVRALPHGRVVARPAAVIGPLACDPQGELFDRGYPEAVVDRYAKGRKVFKEQEPNLPATPEMCVCWMCDIAGPAGSIADEE
jgi:hypothetical protein